MKIIKQKLILIAHNKIMFAKALTFFCLVWCITSVNAQIAPSRSDINNYQGLHKAAHFGDVATLERLIADQVDIEQRDHADRTALHIATYASQNDALRVLAEAGANLNSFEAQAYDIVTIAAVANDIEILNLALSLGASPGNVTSPYDGTALIAAAHLGHHAVVKSLINAGAPLDHINNLGWTALMEAVILGNGGSDYIDTVNALVKAGADKFIGDQNGITPLEHALNAGFTEIVLLLQK